MRFFLFLGALIPFLFTSHAQAKIVAKNVEYRDKDILLEGFLAYEDAK